MTARIPEQDGADVVAEGRAPAGDGPLGSRRIRGRLTFGDAAELGGRPADSATSPWQRAHTAWRTAGLAWDGTDAPPGPAPNAGRPADTSKGAAEDAPKATTKDAPKKAAKPVGRTDELGVKVAPIPSVKDPAKAGTETPAGAARGRRNLKPLAVAAGAVLVVGGGAVYFAAQGDDKGTKRARAAVPVNAERFFATDPAAKSDGMAQELSAVASVGDTLVAAGTEAPVGARPGRERAEFLVSDDAGRSWRLARVRAADGAEPSPGDRPRLLAGTDGSWVALGQNPAGETVAWTSGDGGSWTRQPPSAFGPKDRVTGLVRVAAGFVAAGTTPPNGKGEPRGVLWTSPDGRAWQRVDGLAATGVTGLDRVASAGDAVVAHGTFARTVTRKKGRKGKKRKSVVRGEGVWRSSDGGRTWAPVNVRQANGSYGAVKDLVAGPKGFFAVREGKKTTGRKNKRKTQRYGVVFGSPDGQAWAPVGQVGGARYTGTERLGGSAAGLAALVRGKGGTSVLRSADGRSWQPGPPVGGPAGPVGVAALTVAAGGTPVAAGRAGGDAFLSGADLAKVAGAVTFERTLRSVAASGDRAVAVGSTNGAPAVWTSPARSDAWTRARIPAAAPRQRLTGVVHGPRGWLAVGRAEGRPAQPVTLTSSDGTAWTKAPFPRGQVAEAAAVGPHGYVAVGAAGPNARSWRSADLGAWRPGTVGGGDGAWMTDVAATSTGYAAAGGRRDGRPALWTSPDGLKWTPATLPPGLAGPLDRIVAHGDVLVASGAANAITFSPDGGRTWQARPLTAAPEPIAVTALAATPKGFAAAGTTGRPGRQDVVLWTSADGGVWRRAPGHAAPGGQRLTALTAVGPDLLALGTDSGHRGETPLLWRTPIG